MCKKDWDKSWTNFCENVWEKEIMCKKDWIKLLGNIYSEEGC